MKTVIGLIVLGLVTFYMMACASVSYEAADGTKVSYTRFLTSADSIKANVGTSSVEANGQKIDLATLQYLLGAMAK
jgi:hypothetical protein